MAQWKEVLTQIAPDAEVRMEELRGRLYSQLGGVGPVKIIAFRGFGSQKSLFVRGRVIEETTYLTTEKNEKVWANLLGIYTHAQSRRVPNACLVARFQGVEKAVNANGDGYFEVEFTPARQLTEERLWHPVEFQLLHPIPDAQSRYPIKCMGEVLVPAKTARFGVISNVDESLLPSNPSDLLCMARNAFLRNPHSRQPFPGEAALYRAFYKGTSAGDMNPLFYLSTSAGNMYNLLVQAVNLQSMPNGPVLLSQKSKANRIRQVLDMYPGLPFILFGNLGHDDADLYTRLAVEYAGRIPAIYLRYEQLQHWREETFNILSQRAHQAGCQLVLAPDAMSIARHALEQGFLSESALPDIQKDIHKDERPEDPVEKLLCEPANPSTRAARIYSQATIKGEPQPGAKPSQGSWSAKRNARVQRSVATFSGKKNK